jgi:hypothetical protein
LINSYFHYPLRKNIVYVSEEFAISFTYEEFYSKKLGQGK